MNGHSISRADSFALVGQRRNPFLTAIIHSPRHWSFENCSSSRQPRLSTPGKAQRQPPPWCQFSGMRHPNRHSVALLAATIATIILGTLFASAIPTNVDEGQEILASAHGPVRQNALERRQSGKTNAFQFIVASTWFVVTPVNQRPLDSNYLFLFSF